MRTSTAFFTGAGTVAIAVAAGLGGGLMIAEGMHPKTPAMESTKLERSAPDAPAPSPAGTSYLAATQAAATGPIKVAPAPAGASATPVSTDPAPAPSAAPATTASATTAAPVTTAAAPAAPPPSDAQAGTSDNAQPQVKEKTAEKAQDADVKSRDAERKRVVEQRRAEHHRHYTERRRQRREQDLRDVEQAVREDSAPRAYAAQPVEMETPRFRFFGDD
jgi:hypothetical protein